MDINKLLNDIKRTSKFILFKAKDVFTLPFAKTYMFLSLILIIIFSIINFPYEKFIIQEINKKSSNFSNDLKIENLQFSIFNKTLIKQVNVVTKKNSKIDVLNIVVEPIENIISQYLNDRFYFQISISRFKFENKNLKISSSINIDSNIKYKPNNLIQSQGSIDFNLFNLYLKLKEIKVMNNFTINNINIKKIKINGNINLKNKKIFFKNISITGKDLKGKINGFMLLNQNINNSKLKFSIKLDGNSLALLDYKDIMSSFGLIGEDNYLHLSVSGTIRNPRIIKKIDKE